MKLHSIISTSGMLIAEVYDDLQPCTVLWFKGSHTANVHHINEDDCFTFAWEKNQPTMLDFTTALQNWIDYSQEVNA